MGSLSASGAKAAPGVAEHALNMRCAPRCRRASARGRWRPPGWTALPPAEQPRLFPTTAPTTLQGRGQAPPQNACHCTVCTKNQRRAAAYRAGSTHIEYGGLLRTEPQGPGASVAASPQQSTMAIRLHGALTMGAHGHCISVGDRDDRGVVEHQCSTAHKSDAPIKILRHKKTLTLVKTVPKGTRAHSRVQKHGASRVLKGTERRTRTPSTTGYRGTQNTRILKRA